MNTLFRSRPTPLALLAAVVALLTCGPLITAAAAPPASPAKDGFVSIFDGESLAGWEGNPDFWRVEDGAIVGETTEPLKGTTYLIWRQGEVDDFELRLTYRLHGGNSGIQYRSRNLGGFRVAGYQADMEAGKNYSGILYEQDGRGIVAKRGERVTANADGSKTQGQAIGSSQDLQSHIHDANWNTYRIVATGNQLQHFINGQLMSETIDDQADKRSLQGVLALQLHAGPPMKVEFKDIQLKRLRFTEGRKKLVMVAGRASHAQGAHEFRAGCLLFKKCLDAALPNQLISAVYTDSWPEDPTVFDNADSILLFSDGGKGHPVIQSNRLAQIDALAQRGVGIACLHYGVEVPREKGGPEFLNWIGGFFETDWSVNPTWMLAATELTEGHPICRGVKPFEINDEWYYHMRFREPADAVTAILSAIPPDSTRERADGAHSNNPTVRGNKGAREVLAWAYERPAGGRGFGCTGGHFHENWGNDEFRRLMLNALVWTSGLEVPDGGVTSAVTPAELEANLDPSPPPRKKQPGKKPGGQKPPATP